MARFERKRLVVLGALSALLAALLLPRVIGASKSVDLDTRTANAAESTVALDILTTFPPKVQDRVTNRAVNNKYTFNYASAGPGGFSSQLGLGTTAGVGAQWTWQTAQTIYSFTGSSCANDICFTKVEGPDPAPSNAVAWRVPGRTVVPNSVTVSSASLTASLVTFFSPDQTLVEVTSSVVPLASGQLGYHTTWTNNTTAPVVINIGPAPLGCCPSEGQLNCDGKCVDYLFDEENCGACGNVCGDVCGTSGGYEGESYCYYGYCECDGEEFGGYRLGVSTPDATMVSGRGGLGAARLGQRGDAPRPQRPHLGGVDEAPLCVSEGSTQTIEPGESFDQCSVAESLPREVASVLTICGSAIPDGETACPGGEPASSGTFMQFVPDEDNPYPFPGIFITPYQVTVSDASGDGVLQPGETGLVYISVLNAGTDALLNPAATLSSPDVDLNDDGNDDPIVITQAYSAYAPDLFGVPAGEPGAECGPALTLTPSVNVVAFEVTIPADHPADVARPFTLDFTSESTFGGTFVTVPLSFGIGSAAADLGVTLSDSADPAPAGSNLTYQMVVTNAGPLAAANVEAINTLPAAADFLSVSAPAGWQCSSTDASGTDVVTCTADALAAGESASLSILTRLAACTGPLSLTDAASVSSATPDEAQSDNSASETTQVQDAGPGVQILQPAADQTGSPPVSIPITIRLASQGGTNAAVRETVALEACVLWDGLTYGDRDGLLSDESLQTTKYILCQAMARCGLTSINYPRIVARATNACGAVAQDDVIIRRRLLKTEVCAP